jgi:acetyl/propionyl-CoA carboxylase alpha subunit
MPAQVGAVLAAGARLAGIRNDRADDSRLGELRAALGTSTALIAALADRLAATEAEIARAEAFANVFRQTRMEQLAARREEARAQIAAAQARLQEAESALRRGTALQASGTASVATGDQARRNAQVAQGELSAANEREIAIRTELAAAATGVFAGDQANDRSASQQLLDRLRPLRQEIAAQLAAQRGRATALADQLARETERLAGQAGAEILLPARSRILSLRAQPGEHVVAGQELAVLQDCAQARVVAEVDLRTFRALHLGMPAEFAPASGEARRAGEVVQLLLPLEAGPLAGETPRFRVEVRLAAAAADAARCDPVQTGSLRFP